MQPPTPPTPAAPAAPMTFAQVMGHGYEICQEAIVQHTKKHPESTTSKVYNFLSSSSHQFTDKVLPKLYHLVGEQKLATAKRAFAMFPACAFASRNYKQAANGMLTHLVCEMDKDPQTKAMQRPLAIGLLAWTTFSALTEAYSLNLLGTFFDVTNAARIGALLIEKKNA